MIMETLFIIIVSLFITAIIKFIILGPGRGKQPPGPPFLTTIFLLLTKPPIKFKPVLINLKAKYGPIFALSFGFAPNIFVSDRSLAYQILIQKGAVFSDRPKSVITCTISTTSYGHAWRILRRNLATEIMHSTRIKSYAWVRKWVLRILIERIGDSQGSDECDGVKVVDHFRYAMFSLLVFMCFGEKVDESKIEEIAKVHRELLLNFASGRFSVLTLFPNLGKVLFRNRWKEFEKSRGDRDKVIVPLIKSRIGSVNSENGLGNEDIVAYVDTLVNLQYPIGDNNNSNNNNNNNINNNNIDNNNNNNGGNGRRLTDMEIASLCSEFLNAGIDTTTTALQWIMANIVKHPRIQSKLYDEIVEVVGPPPPPPQKGVELESESYINEEDLQKMPYLKAVVLEGLRRHPPVHFLLPHRVTKEVDVQGYTIPQGATINFMVSEMGLDPSVWDEPMEFKPERFLVHDCVFDVTGRKGIKMMPFGAGRRICPGSDLALLHLEYFVANLIWYFNWTVPDGCEVDFSEKTEFAVVMKNPLIAQVSSRAKK